MVRRSLLWLMLVPGAVQAAAHPCAAVPEPGARLACYDQAFPPRTPDAPAAPAVPGAKAASVEFGFTAEKVRARSADATREMAPSAVAMTVSSLRRVPTGEFVVTMDNGQVWTQTEINSKARIRAGSAVTIKRGLLGSYRLVTADGIGTSVRRLE